MNDEEINSLRYCTSVQVKYCLSCVDVPNCLKSLPCALPGSKEDEALRLKTIGATLIEEAVHKETNKDL